MKSTIVSAKWLHKNLKNKDLIILDASQNENKTNLKSEFENLQIENARFFDLKNTFSDHHSDLPNMLPNPKDFEKECRKLGIPIISIVDTNCDPDLVDYPIPANDDSVRSIKFIVYTLANAILDK